MWINPESSEKGDSGLSNSQWKLHGNPMGWGSHDLTLGIEVLILPASKLTLNKEARSRFLFKASGFVSCGPSTLVPTYWTWELVTNPERMQISKDVIPWLGLLQNASLSGSPGKDEKGDSFHPHSSGILFILVLSLTFFGTCEMVRKVKFSYWSLLSSALFLITW